MSACKTGCGTDVTDHDAEFCDACDAEFMASPEYRRFNHAAISLEASLSALVDFCARVRAERLNGGSNGRA